MKVAIRDDDLCAWSDYAVFSGIYNELQVPVSASVVPFAVANHGGCMPYGDYPKNKEKCITENESLVKALQRDVAGKKVEVLLHGYSHQYDDDLVPEMCWKEKERLKKELTEGKKLLESLFNPIDVFVAPSQGINAKGIEVLEELGLDYSGSPNRIRERKLSIVHLANVLKRHLERFCFGRPSSVFRYTRHMEVPICALQPLERLKKYYGTCKRHNWNLVIVVHYWRLAGVPEEMKWLRDFVSFVKSEGGDFYFVSECFPKHKCDDGV